MLTHMIIFRAAFDVPKPEKPMSHGAIPRDIIARPVKIDPRLKSYLGHAWEVLEKPRAPRFAKRDK